MGNSILAANSNLLVKRIYEAPPLRGQYPFDRAFGTTDTLPSQPPSLLSDRPNEVEQQNEEPIEQHTEQPADQTNLQPNDLGGQADVQRAEPTGRAYVNSSEWNGKTKIKQSGQHDIEQLTNQANSCANGNTFNIEGSNNVINFHVHCSNTANQIQGDENKVKQKIGGE